MERQNPLPPRFRIYFSGITLLCRPQLESRLKDGRKDLYLPVSISFDITLLG